MFLNQTKPFYRKKKFIIPVAIFAFLVLVRIIIQPIIHKELNKFLATFSPSYKFYVGDLDISLLRGSYSFDAVTGTLKNNGLDFFKAQSIDVSIAWREILKGKILTDIALTGADFIYVKDLGKTADKKTDAKDAKEAKDKLFPVKVERLDISDSNITFKDFPNLNDDKGLKVSGIQGRVTNLTPDKKFPLSFFNVTATMQGSSVLKTGGQLNLLAQPAEWSVDSELQGFDLKSANAFLRDKLPLTFTKGKLDLYAEAQSEHGKIEGYVKPFMKDLDIMKSENYKGVKHFGIEILTAIGNLLLRTSDSHTVATKIPFSYDGAFKVDSGEAVSGAIKHGYDQKLSPGIEDKFELK